MAELHTGSTRTNKSAVLKLGLGGVLAAIVALAVVFLSNDQPASALVGTIAGHGFTLDGTVVGGSHTGGSAVNRVDLPPGGSSSNALSTSDPNGTATVTINGTSPSVSCSGTSSGPTISAACSSSVQD